LINGAAKKLTDEFFAGFLPRWASRNESGDAAKVRF
jgi:hypothetical protein